MTWNGWVLPFKHAFKQTVHVISLERGLQMAHLVSYAAKGPDVRLEVVRLILPHLGAGVVRSSCLRVQKALLGDFADIQVTQLGRLILVEEDIGTLHVPMQYVELVEGLEPSNYLNEDLPDVLLLVVLLVVLILADALEYITIISIFHHDAERVT